LPENIILYDYCRSSAAYRVRIALNLKNFKYQQQSVNLLDSAQTSTLHQQRNTQKLVPVLCDNDVKISQSMAICEYLDEAYPDSPQLVTGTAVERAKIRSFSQAIACEIHPLNNLRVLKYLVSEIGATEEQKLQWYHHWINSTFCALEQQLSQRSNNSTFCFTDQPGLAEACLIPQVFNARRFNIDMHDYPLLMAIDQQCQALPAFAKAHPGNQPDS